LKSQRASSSSPANADFTLTNPPQTDAEGNTRSFSLACAPFEDDLIITTRMRDTAFKHSLKLIDLGTELDLEAPWGELTLHKDTSIPAVFLTGGIGITPVRSIVLQATHDKLAHPSSSSTPIEPPATRSFSMNSPRHKDRTLISPSSPP
jgi:Na+-transporting NADH:ubiquinone oxidoreductase subunit NqrF